MKSSVEVLEEIVVFMTLGVIFPYAFNLKHEHVLMMESQIISCLFGAY